MKTSNQSPDNFLSGSHKLCNIKRVKIQPSNTHLPPMEGQQAGVWPKLFQQGRRRRFCHSNDQSFRGE